MILIVVSLGVALLLYIINKTYIKHWHKNLSVELNFSEAEVFPGDEVILTEIVSNGKWIPVPMVTIKFAIDRSLVFTDVVMNVSISDKCYKSDVFSLLFFQKVSRRLPFTCNKRGLYLIESIDLVSSDIFLSDILGYTIPTHQSLTVCPAPLSAEEIDIPYHKIMGTILAKQFAYEDPFEFRGIREYQTYDTMNSINWNASARTGDLKVNIHDYTAAQEVCILLNLENEGILTYETLKEKSISMACALTFRLTQQGVGVSIISGGVDAITGERLSITSGCDESHRKEIMIGLSRIDLDKDMTDFLTIMEEKRNSLDKGTHIVMISTCKKVKLQEKYHLLTQECAGGLWLFPIHPGMDGRFREVNENDIIRWEVQYGE